MDQTPITDLLPSARLREAIRDTGHRFTDRELLLMAEQYAATRKQRVNALEYIAACCADPRVREKVEDRLAYHRDAMERMLSPEKDTVYAAEIRTEPDAYNEHYLCKTYAAALRAIRGFCEEYTVALRDNSSVEVKKYRILDENDDFAECELGEICLTKDLEIASADYWPLEEGHGVTDDGTLACIRFPDVLAPYSPVAFTDWQGKQYGLQVKSLREGDDDDAYVIYLDAESVNAQDLSGFGNAHCHVAIPLVEEIPPEQLPEKERANYFRLAAYLKDRGII